MSGTYGLGFITDEQLYQHVKETVQKYRFKINLSQFNKNLLDPIKLTFDSKVYGKTIREIIESESIRQIDKSNTNHIGYFHQNIFNFIDGWEVPERGFDAINTQLNIYAELKNKHNTMNSASSQKTYMKMQNKIVREDNATCYLVEVIAKNSQDIPWSISLDGEKIAHKNIRRISIDKFYEIATGDVSAFRNLCQVLPKVIDDIVAETNLGKIENSVFSELEAISDDVLKSIYLLPFQKYLGFDELNFT
ncbi:Eco47II family restriction endonuclease [Vibrio sp. McD22-P3]|uniref:Eco47II family restriction endonuclease n=1 Tax=Vibrio sp. McD22-P3 TaxID=2724880 RepID=UPI001F296FB9|nr:Eco47II family restriction endonuclease [Vibrio sp. McD22-P3]MCF4176236.1 Eco47II family restriction endonuclease [Vibrio sp. McD22-P3]